MINDNYQEEKASLARVTKTRAVGCYGIAALAVINAAIIIFLGADNTYFSGFGFTEIFLVFLPGQNITVLISLVTLFIVLLFTFLGICAGKTCYWAFIVGFFLYAVDCLILILIQDWYSVVMHFIILYFLFQGLNAAKEYREKEIAEKTRSSY